VAPLNDRLAYVAKHWCGRAVFYLDIASGDAQQALAIIGEVLSALPPAAQAERAENVHGIAVPAPTIESRSACRKMIGDIDDTFRQSAPNVLKTKEPPCGTAEL
jgi:hypothetical protein